MDLNLSEYTAHLTGLTAALVTVGKVLEKLYKIKKRSKLFEIENVQKRDLKIYQEMRHILEKTTAKRVVLLYVHNGGDIPQIGKPLYSSVSHESVADGEELIASRWSKQLIDEAYNRMLVDMINDPMGIVTVNVKDMPNSILKDTYKANCIKKTKVMHVYTYKAEKKLFNFTKELKKARMWYLSVVFKDEHALLAHEKDEIRSSLNNIKTLMKEQYALG